MKHVCELGYSQIAVIAEHKASAGRLFQFFYFIILW